MEMGGGRLGKPYTPRFPVLLSSLENSSSTPRIPHRVKMERDVRNRWIRRREMTSRTRQPIVAPTAAGTATFEECAGEVVVGPSGYEDEQGFVEMNGRKGERTCDAGTSLVHDLLNDALRGGHGDLAMGDDRGVVRAIFVLGPKSRVGGSSQVKPKHQRPTS